MQLKDISDLADVFSRILEKKGIHSDRKKVEKVVELVRERADFPSELWDNADFFFQSPEEYDRKTVKKKWKENSPEIITALKEVLTSCDPFDAETIEKQVKSWIEENDFGMGVVMNSWRLCLVGASRGPGLFDIAEIIGKEETLSRMQKALGKLGN
jgi:glutamyl-tRNA synthetase